MTLSRKWRVLKTISLILVFLIANMNITYSATNELNGHWAESQLIKWLENGLLKGYQDGKIRPDQKVSRSEFITFVNRVFQYAEEAPITFNDVSNGNWYYSEIAKGLAAGYIQDDTDPSFKPNDYITREEAAVIVARLANLDTGKVVDSKLKLIDIGDASPSSYGSILSLVETGIIIGYSDQTFKPNQAISRAEAIVVLDRLINKLANTTITYDQTGEYGPTSGNKIIFGDVIVSSGNVTLQNLEIKGDLILAKEINEGEVFLKNVKVHGTTHVLGGGKNSIYFIDSILLNVFVDKVNGEVRIVIEGRTKVENMEVESSVILEERNLASGYGFNNVMISEKIEANARIGFKGNFGEVHILASNIFIDLLVGSINELITTNLLHNVTINTSAGTNIGSVFVNSPIKVNGYGVIGTIYVTVQGAFFEMQPRHIDNPNSLYVQIGIPVSSGGGGGGPKTKTIQNITPIPNITGVPNGTEITDIEVMLPAQAEVILNDNSKINVDVEWIIDSLTTYDKDLKTEQTFTVEGTLMNLPARVVNQNGITASVQVTVEGQFAGGDGSMDDPYVIETPSQLNNVRNYLFAHFVLGNDIDLDIAPYNQGEGWIPIGDNVNKFIGNFNGNGKTIYNLFIKRADPNSLYTGLFGFVESGTITNLILDGIDVTGGKEQTAGIAGTVRSSTLSNISLSNVIVKGTKYTGGLTGYSLNAAITNIDLNTIDVQAEGHSYIGGLVGYSNISNISNSTIFNANITGKDRIGGLIGFNQEGTISYSKAENVNVSGTTASIGGLVGDNWGIIRYSSVTGVSSVEGNINVGGLAGHNSKWGTVVATIEKSFSEANVIAYSQIAGGLVGQQYAGRIFDSYATGTVQSKNTIGGLVGFLTNSGQITNSYALGKVTATEVDTYNVGGLVGSYDKSAITSSYYNSETTGQNDDTGKGTPKTTADMMQGATYVGWDFDDIWQIDAGASYPTLRQ